MGSPRRRQKPVEAASFTRTEKRRGCHLCLNDARRARRISCHKQDQPHPQPASSFNFHMSGLHLSRDCKSRIGLYSHTRCCSLTNPHYAIPQARFTDGCQWYSLGFLNVAISCINDVATVLARKCIRGLLQCLKNYVVNCCLSCLKYHLHPNIFINES